MKPTKIFSRLEEIISLDAPPQRLRTVIESELIGYFAVLPIQAAEQAERLEFPVARLIMQKQLQCERSGIIAALTVIGSAADVVAGSCHVSPSDSALVAEAKAHRIHAEPLWAHIRSLHFNEFEVFGAKVLKQLGAQEVYVTRQSNDQGIDFYGTLNFGRLQNSPFPFFKLAHDLDIRFAGQAKHYPNTAIGTNVLRELVGAVSLARFKTYSIDEDLFERLSLRPLSPLVSFMFTTGRLTSGAIDLAQKTGIVARSGMQLAVYLADCGVGMKSYNGLKVFDAGTFHDWLEAN